MSDHSGSNQHCALTPVTKMHSKTVRDMKCSVTICLNSKLKNPETQFFGFPPESQPERLNTWKKATNKPNLPKNCQKNACICENHFQESDFAPLLGAQYSHIQLSSSVKKVLHRQSVPTRNLNPKVKISFDAANLPKTDLVSIEIKAYHLPSFKAGLAENCHHCTKSTPDQINMTKYKCEACDVKLCLRPCFEGYHKSLNTSGSPNKCKSNYIYILQKIVKFIMNMEVLDRARTTI